MLQMLGNFKDYMVPIPERNSYWSSYDMERGGLKKTRIEKVENFFKSSVEKLEPVCKPKHLSLYGTAEI